MIAVRSLGNRKVETYDAPKPEAKGTDIVVRVKAAPICGSDLHALYRRPDPHKVIPGHEISGEVAEAGASKKWKPGDRVCVPAAIGCGFCEMCRKGFTIYCDKAGIIGFGQDGGHAEYVVVPEDHPLRLPDDVSFESGSLITDPVGVPFHACKSIGLTGRDTVAVFGLGPMGLGAVIMAKFLGATVIAVEPIEYRLKLAKSLGADWIINPGKQKVREAIREITKGLGPDKAIECAGRADTLELCLDLARKLGKVAIIGENSTATIKPSDQFLRKELTMVGGTCFNLGEYDEIVETIRRGLAPERIITHRFGLKDAAEAYRLFDEGNTGKVVFTP